VPELKPQLQAARKKITMMNNPPLETRFGSGELPSVPRG
jgi:hypothetical protein